MDEEAKRRLLATIESKVAKVQALDLIVIGQMREDRFSYDNKQVFTACLETLLEAAKGKGIIEFVELNCNLTPQERVRLSELTFSYGELKSNIYGIYAAHSYFKPSKS
jgi:hypothetical protein